MTSSPIPEGPGPGVRREHSQRSLIGGAAAASAAAALVPYRDAAATAHNPSPEAAGNLLSSRGNPGQC
jgi:hypothetical protein